ncbi:MAG TPA: single-stranded DNA-binding protein [Pilimelia sp.]|nr:single-stranded DNA-binding protein [Pilimelia sp.]
MFDTHVTIVGNVLTAPEWRRTSNTNSLVANFKVASTARRLNRETGQWVDGNSLRVRVNCWRRLAEGVASSVMVGDPVVVVGRLYTRDWTDGEGNHRTLYELEAVAIGHDLSRGRAKFVRNRPAMTTSAVEDAEAEARVHGERTEPVSVAEAPARPGEYLFDDDGDPDFADVPVSPVGYDAIAVMRGGGFDAAPVRPGAVGHEPAGVVGGTFAERVGSGVVDLDGDDDFAAVALDGEDVTPDIEFGRTGAERAAAEGGDAPADGEGSEQLAGEGTEGRADLRQRDEPSGRGRRGRARAAVPV